MTEKSFYTLSLEQNILALFSSSFLINLTRVQILFSQKELIILEGYKFMTQYKTV